jgi:hypothetical protein
LPSAVLALVFIGRRASGGIANVADPILVKIGLIRVRDEWAIVYQVKHPIAIVVKIARIPETVAIRIGLIRVKGKRAVVDGIRDPIVVVI